MAFSPILHPIRLLRVVFIGFHVVCNYSEPEAWRISEAVQLELSTHSQYFIFGDTAAEEIQSEREGVEVDRSGTDRYKVDADILTSDKGAFINVTVRCGIIWPQYHYSQVSLSLGW